MSLSPSSRVWGVAPPRPRRRWIILLVAAVLIVGWVGYQRFFAGPSPLPLPASAAISIEAGRALWPAVNGDVGARRGTSAGVRLGAEVAWRTDLGAAVVAAVVADGRALYVALEDGKLLALSVEDGSTLWCRVFPFPLRASPAVAGGRLFVSARGGQEPLIALDAVTGQEIWAVETGSTFATSPVVVDGVVHAFYNTRADDSAGHGELVGLAAEDGALLWRRSWDALWPIVPPVFAGESIAMASGQRLVILDRVTGEQQFFYSWGARRPTYVAAGDGVVYGLTPRILVAVDVATRRPGWERFRRAWTWMDIFGIAPAVPDQPRDWVVRPPPDPHPAVVGRQAVIVAGKGGEVRSYDRESGEERWRTTLRPIVGPPVLTADGLLVTLEDALVLLDAADGTEIGRRAFASRGLREAIVTAHGTYVVFAEGAVVALR